MLFWERAIAAGRASGVVHQGLWFDVGTPAAIARDRGDARRWLRRRAPGLYTIPAHRAFADALAAGLIRRFGGDPTAAGARAGAGAQQSRQARGTDAFVRASGGGLLLPRLVAIGDADWTRRSARRSIRPTMTRPVPPAVAPLERRMILARLVRGAREPAAVDAAEAVRLAGDLARTLDQLLVEEVRAGAAARRSTWPRSCREHWERALATVRDRARALAGRAGAARAGSTWPSGGRGCSIALARALARDAAGGVRLRGGDHRSRRRRSRGCCAASRELPRGHGRAAGLSTWRWPTTEWDALGPHEPDPGHRARARGRSRRIRNST